MFGHASVAAAPMKMDRDKVNVAVALALLGQYVLLARGCASGDMPKNSGNIRHIASFIKTAPMSSTHEHDCTDFVIT